MSDREAFEKWAQEKLFLAWNKGRYSAYDTQRAWEAWQAAQAQTLLEVIRTPPAAAVPDAWKPSGIEYDRAIHHNPDAVAWAGLFMETFPDCGADKELMIGWFANAMMAMFDYLDNRPTPPAAQSQEVGNE